MVRHSLGSLLLSPLLLLIIALSSCLPFTALSRLVPTIDDACASTEFPKLCQAILSSYETLPTLPDSGFSGLGKHVIRRSMMQADKMSRVIEHYISSKKSHHSPQMLGALSDCAKLSDSSAGYLQLILDKCRQGNFARLTVAEVERLETLISGVLANERMCFNGLKESNSTIDRALEKPLSDRNQMFRVTLQLINQGFSQNQIRNRDIPDSVSNNLIYLSGNVRIPLEYLIYRIRNGHCNASGNCRWRKHPFFDNGGITIDGMVTVGKTGWNTFETIQEALNHAPRYKTDAYHVIYVREGVYEEYAVVPNKRKNILLLGDGIGKTIITGSHSHEDGWGTYNTASFGADADGFMAVDISFENTAGPNKGPAVACRVVGDRATFYRCSFSGFQDTLLNHRGRQFFRDCDIYGSIDFIFGFGTATFQNCNIYSRDPNPRAGTVVTAHGRESPEENTGYIFQNCNFVPTPELSKNKRVENYLGRPWYPYARVVIMNSHIDKHINSRGWTPMNGKQGLDTLFFGEFGNRGEGSSTKGRVKWKGFHVLNEDEARPYTVDNFMWGYSWLPQTDVPHNGGLIHN